MGAPKAGVRLSSGKTLARAVADALAQVCDDVVVLGHGEGCPEELSRLEDPPGEAGPLAGIHALLRSGLGGRYLVVSCDMPMLSPSLLARLLDVGGKADAACFQVEGRDRLEPLPLLLTPVALPSVEEQLSRADLRLMSFVEALHPERLPLSRVAAEALANVNRPEDLARLPVIDPQGRVS